MLLLAIAASSSALRGGFVHDDRTLIVRNDALRGWAAAPSVGAIGPMLTADFAQRALDPVARDMRAIRYYRPVITATFVVDTAFWGHATADSWTHLDPFGFHVTNLLWHAIAAALVWFVARALTRSSAVATAAAALFAVHPIHTESVMWISGRTDVVATVWCLASLWSYLRFRRSGSRPAYVASVSFATVALFAKESAAAVPLFLLAYEAVRGDRRPLAVAPFFAVVAGFALVRRAALGPAAGADGWEAVPFATILVSSFDALRWYLLKLLWPVPLTIEAALPFSTGFGWLVGAVAVAAIGVGVVVAVRRQRGGAAAFAGVAMLAAYAPVSCLVPGARLRRGAEAVGFPIAERFLYLPSVFAAILAAWAFVALCRRAPWIRWVGAAVIAVCAVVTFDRGVDWRDERSLYAATARVSPDSARARRNHGLALLNALRIPEARAELEASRRLRAQRGLPPAELTTRCLAACDEFDGEHHRALERLRRAVAIAPTAGVLLELAFSASVVGAIESDPARLEESLLAYRAVPGRLPARAAGHAAAVEEALRVLRSPTAGAAARATAVVRLADACATAVPPRYVDAVTILAGAIRRVDGQQGAEAAAVRNGLERHRRMIATRARWYLGRRLAADPGNAALARWMAGVTHLGGIGETIPEVR